MSCSSVRTGLGVAHLVAHRDEHELAAATFLLGDGRDGGNALDLRSDPQRTQELEAASRPHAPGQLDGRKEAALRRVAIGTGFRLAITREEI
jgi:hypothetical protein